VLHHGKSFAKWTERCASGYICVIHSFSDLSLFGTTHYWNYLENLDQCLPGVEAREVLRAVKELQKSSVGRGRVFILLALNRGNSGEII